MGNQNSLINQNFENSLTIKQISNPRLLVSKNIKNEELQFKSSKNQQQQFNQVLKNTESQLQNQKQSTQKPKQQALQNNSDSESIRMTHLNPFLKKPIIVAQAKMNNKKSLKLQPLDTKNQKQIKIISDQKQPFSGSTKYLRNRSNTNSNNQIQLKRRNSFNEHPNKKKVKIVQVEAPSPFMKSPTYCRQKPIISAVLTKQKQSNQNDLNKKISLSKIPPTLDQVQTIRLSRESSQITITHETIIEKISLQSFDGKRFFVQSVHSGQLNDIDKIKEISEQNSKVQQKQMGDCLLSQQIIIQQPITSNKLDSINVPILYEQQEDQIFQNQCSCSFDAVQKYCAK